MKIGVFDSGLGGLTIVRSMMHLLHGVEIFYIADTRNAPYGEKPKEQILEYSIRITEYFLKHFSIDALVVACNTATSAAINELRETYPELIIVGTEPGLKPAISHSITKKVGVLATPATLNGDKYKALVHMLGEHYHVEVFEQACHGLVDQIEKGETFSPKTLSMLENWLSPMRSADVDTIVLGCTHYPLISRAIEQVMGKPMILVDSAEGVSKRTLYLLEQKGHLNVGENHLDLFVTGPIEPHMVKEIMGQDFSLRMIDSLE